jgi:AcrR family transcriptional regulator
MNAKIAAAAPRRPVPSDRWNGRVLGRDEQRDLKRIAILHAAAKMFVENGYHETSLADIAASLHVTKPTLYYYVSSKEEMLAQIASAALEGSEEHFRDACARGRDALDALRVFTRAYVVAMNGDFGRCLLAARHLRFSPETQEKLTAGFRRIDTFVRDLIERGARDGSIASVDPRMSAFVFYGAVNWIPHWYRDGGSMSPEQAADAMFDVLSAGFARATGAPSQPSMKRKRAKG